MSTKYFPIIKWKAGEQTALFRLAYNPSTIMPVIQIVDDIEPKVFFQRLQEIFPSPVYIDTSAHENEDATCTVLRDYIQFAQRNRIAAYPIIDYQSMQYIPPGITNIAIYIPVPLNVGMQLSTIIQEISSHTQGIEIDLFLNAGIVWEQHANIINSAYTTILSQLVSLRAEINNFIICLTSFPENVSGIPSAKTATFQRFDIQIFTSLHAHFNQIKHRIHYSDYGVTKYTESDIDFSRLRNPILPKIKYTTDNLYFIMKGSNNPRITYIDLAKALVSTPYYNKYGATFCYGDNEIALKAQGTNGIGNNTNWVAYCCNHHLAVVLEQLSKLP